MALVTIRVRRGTAAEWTAANPTLAIGEPGFETDTLKIKYGNGSTQWTSLAYAASGGGGGAITSVNGHTGVVVLNATDVGAVDSSTFTEQLQDAVSTTLVGGTGLTVSYNDTSGQITLTPAVSSVAGRTGLVTLTKTDVGLNNVDNTSDVNKPISTAQQAGLDGKLANVVAGQSVAPVVVVAHGAATPAGLPNGTVVVELL